MPSSIDHLLAKVERYRKYLTEEEHAVAVRLENRKARFTRVGRSDLTNHLLWMCDRIMVCLDEGRTARAWRWLGYVEGSMYVLDIVAIDDMRDDVAEDAVIGEVACAD